MDGKRIEAIRVYLSQGSQAKRNKNMQILRKKGEINKSEQNHHKNIYPMISGNETANGLPQYLKYGI